jgi:hypothetical protein
MGDTGQRESRRTFSEPMDMEASETVLLELSVNGFSCLPTEFKNGVTDLFHSILKSLQQVAQILAFLNLLAMERLQWLIKREQLRNELLSGSQRQRRHPPHAEVVDWL